MSEATKDGRNANGELPGISQSLRDLIDSEVVYYDDCGDGDLELFEHQVSGHGVAEKGLLKNKSGHLLKPLQPPPKGEREVRFYRNVHSSANPCYSNLREFVPSYYGMACVRKPATGSGDGPKASYYLVIEDILKGLAKPCVMDIKIGVQTWSPDASAEKIAQETSKYVGTRPQLGVCVTGMHYWQVNNTFTKARLSREEGKSLDVAGFERAMVAYFNVGSGPASTRVVEEVIKRLERIESVFSRNREFRLYGSSVLVAYDANGLVGGRSDPEIRVSMIDFAHFHDEDRGGGLDENYLFGLRSLLGVLGRVRGRGANT